MNVRIVEATPPTSQDPKRERMLETLRGILRENLRLKNAGSTTEKMAHGLGYADGYMSMLVDSGFATQQELLNLVAEVRRGEHGPATAHLMVETEALSA